ncbi:biotin--[acetyl-CoA-carboxylase] ligase [Chloroflexota bacterium]
MKEDSLSPSAITDNLETEFIGRKVIYYPRLASTMDMARQEAQKGTAAGTVIITDEQTAGKGRLMRRWYTLKGNIALSIVLYPDRQFLSYLVMLASLAVVSSIETVTGLKTQIKWPNDVLVNGKKVCGILTESSVVGNEVAYAIVGIGINVNLKLDDYPELQSTATSLVNELGEEVSRLGLIRCLLMEFERWYLALSAGDSVYLEWRERLVTLGRKVKVTSGNNILEGVAESVAADGSLQLRQRDGSLTTIVAGDVTLRENG